MNVVIRDACEQDYEAVYLLNKNGFGYDFDIYSTRRRLEYILEKDSDRIFVAEVSGHVAGYAHVADYECTYMEPLKNILAIVVDENKRGQGIGRALLNSVEDWAKETGASGVRLVSGFDREKAHKFYLSCGYTDRKNQKNFIKIFSEVT